MVQREKEIAFEKREAGLEKRVDDLVSLNETLRREKLTFEGVIKKLRQEVLDQARENHIKQQELTRLMSVHDETEFEEAVSVVHTTPSDTTTTLSSKEVPNIHGAPTVGSKMSARIEEQWLEAIVTDVEEVLATCSSMMTEEEASVVTHLLSVRYQKNDGGFGFESDLIWPSQDLRLLCSSGKAH